MTKLKVGIIGTGNIGTDLLYKSLKSDKIEPTLFMGKRNDSEGIQIAKRLGIPTSINSIEALIQHPERCDLVFDATTASAHYEHARILKRLGKKVIDMTPARVGKMCIPAINAQDCLNEENINMVTCGGQASVPIIKAVSTAMNGRVRYAEVIATIASKSAGIGTRNNIDEFTQTTKDAIIQIGKVNNAKAIIVLNPANPPITMHNTIYLDVENPDMPRISDSVHYMVKKVQEYVPGYAISLEPTLENGHVVVMVQVTGAGDYLPAYAGNLDIISCAGVKMAEMWKEQSE